MGTAGLTDNQLVRSLDPATRIIVVGNGPVGVHFVQQLQKLTWPGEILLFGEEPYKPYNRVKLSAFLNGDISLAELDNSVQGAKNLVQHMHCRIEQIDTSSQCVIDQFGQSHHYDKLVLATGSRAFIPNISGTDLAGVYRFRDLDDTQALFTRRLRSRHTVVIGGGLLGLETAKAMLKYSTKVSLIHHGPLLMNRQLDEKASARLQAFAEKAGIQVLLSTRVQEILGNQRVTSLRLNKENTIECDTVVFATGIKPNTDLALDANLAVRRGIQIDSDLCTSNKSIFAIGECADYQGQVFGLVAPGLEQASVLAANLSGLTSHYLGSTLVTELKVLGLSVFSMGMVTEEYSQQIDSSCTYTDQDHYRRLFFQKGKLVGALAIGPCAEVKALQAAVESQRLVWPWQKWRFQRSGKLFSGDNAGLQSLPDKTIICNCQQVSLGQIRTCLAQQNVQFETLQQELAVSTVCGTCKPLVQTIMDSPADKLPIKKILLSISAFAFLCLTLFAFIPKFAVSESVQNPGWDWLWTDSLARQVSGFTMLGLTIFSFLLSIRKRLPKVRWLSFDFWRSWHVFLTCSALLVLFAHTGASMGDGINFWLITNFLAIALLGVATGIVASMEGHWLSTSIKRVKRSLVWGHILLFWPLPILLTYHILSVYYF